MYAFFSLVEDTSNTKTINTILYIRSFKLHISTWDAFLPCTTLAMSFKNKPFIVYELSLDLSNDTHVSFFFFFFFLWLWNWGVSQVAPCSNNCIGCVTLRSKIVYLLKYNMFQNNGSNSQLFITHESFLIYLKTKKKTITTTMSTHPNNNW